MREYLTGWRLPLEFELLFLCQLLLDGIMHTLNEHALVAKFFEDLRLARGVTERVNGPRVLWRHTECLLEPFAPFLKMPTGGTGRDRRLVVHNPSASDKIESFFSDEFFSLLFLLW